VGHKISPLPRLVRWATYGFGSRDRPSGEIAQ
jgi:hypothetical protein